MTREVPVSIKMQSPKLVFPFRRTTYTRTGGFCPGANPEFQRVARQNPPVLWLTESACSCPEQPLSATHGRQRYNTLDFAGKVVCHETAGFIGFFLPRRVLPSIGCLPPRQRCRLWKPLPRERCPLWIPQPTGRSPPLLETQSQRNLPSLWNPRSVLKGVPTNGKWFVGIHSKTQKSPEHQPIRR